VKKEVKEEENDDHMENKDKIMTKMKLAGIIRKYLSPVMPSFVPLYGY
jgi:hypothetical protein